MRRLNTTQIARRDEIAVALERTWAEIQDVLLKLEAALELHNEAREDAQGFVEEILGDINEYIESRSEKWLESEKGAAYDEWHGAWDEVSSYAFDPLDPDAVHGADDVSEVLRELPDEPNV